MDKIAVGGGLPDAVVDLDDAPNRITSYNVCYTKLLRAVNAMRMTLGTLDIDGTVRIGEGERDEAPMLYIGEKVGSGGPPIDIALDPLEGTTITAKGGPNALAVLAMAQDGGFLNAPDTHMDKIAVGGGLPDAVVDLDEPPKANP